MLEGRESEGEGGKMSIALMRGWRRSKARKKRPMRSKPLGVSLALENLVDARIEPSNSA